MLGIAQIGKFYFIFRVESLNLLQHLEWVVFDWLLQSCLDDFFVNDIDDEIEVFFNFLLLLLDYFLFGVVF